MEGLDFNPVTGATVSLLTDAETDLPLVSPNRPIPDGDGTEIMEAFTVTESIPLAEVFMAINIEHSYIGDLTVKLVHPDGTTVLLHNGSGGSSSDINTVYPTETAPAESLSKLNGKTSAGVWKLIVKDSTRSDSGTLISYQFSFSGTGIGKSTTSDANGYYQFQDVDSGTVNIGVTAAGMSFDSRSLELRADTAHFNFVSIK